MARFWVGNQIRRERPSPPLRTPVQHNGFYYVAVEPQRSPAPIRYGVQNHARPARKKRYSVLTRQDYRSVMRNSLLGNKITLVHHVSQPRGKQKPFGPRSNIERNPSRSYGTRFTNVPQVGQNDGLLAEMGM